MTDDITEPGHETTPVIGANDGALPPETTAPVTHSPYDAALAAGNVPDLAQPSGGGTATDDVGNVLGSTTGDPLSGSESASDASQDTASSEPTKSEDPGEAEYEAARLAATKAGETSWPIWAFLPLEQKLTYIPAA